MRHSFQNHVFILFESGNGQHAKPSQNAIATLPDKTKAKTPAPLPEAKQTKLDSVLDILDELTKQELKTVIAMTKELAKCA